MPDEIIRASRQSPLASRRRLGIWSVYLALFALSIPWYLPADKSPPLWLGLPYWVVLSMLAVAAIAAFTVWVVLRHWPLDEGEAIDDR